MFGSNRGNLAALSLFNCQVTMNDSLIDVKNVHGQQSIGTVEFPFHISILACGAVIGKLNIMQWKHHGHHDLETNTNPVNFKAISPQILNYTVLSL